MFRDINLKQLDRHQIIGLLGAGWGLIGFALLLIYTILRLLPLALEAFRQQLQWYHWAVLIINTLFMAYAEGYRGFQKGLSPRVVARAKYLKNKATLLYALLGPLYCMGYFYIGKRRQISTITLTLVIIGFIFLVRLLDQPWRGIIDVGVILGLSWGLVSLVIFTVQAFTAATFDYSPEVPDKIESL